MIWTHYSRCSTKTAISDSSSTTLTNNAKESTTLTARDVPPLRRSTRTRKAPRRLDIDPVQKSYRTRGTNS
ncbi:hypothetical protein Aduo_019033 [Ancylostoma duodenale]